ncbi:major facilitator superfamily domain-containing protein [Aspergillus venezuelensis]
MAEIHHALLSNSTEKAPSQSQPTTTDTEDPNLVDFNGPNDPLDPQNFPPWQKWLYANIIGWLLLVVTFAASVFSAATGTTATEFHVSPQVTTLRTALFIAGFAAGPLLFGPLSELYGRKRPLMAGIAGCYFADFFDPVQRGLALAVFSGTTLVGPIIGPIVGGFISESSLGWRWTSWITMIMAATAGLIRLVFLPETYAPLLLQRKAAQLRLETRHWALHAKLDESPITLSSITTRYLSRPLLMLTHEPILQLITAYMTFIYGFIYLLFEAYPISFIEERHYTLGIGAWPFLSIGLGAQIIFTAHIRPEERLYPMIPGSVLLPVGILLFAWTSFPSLSIWDQVVAGVPLGAGIQSIVAAGFTMFAMPMYHRLGACISLTLLIVNLLTSQVQWASSLLSFFGVAFIPIPIIFYIYGERIRKPSRYSPTL